MEELIMKNFDRTFKTVQNNVSQWGPETEKELQNPGTYRSIVGYTSIKDITMENFIQPTFEIMTDEKLGKVRDERFLKDLETVKDDEILLLLVMYGEMTEDRKIPNLCVWGRLKL
jgi:hypothetical protein